MNKWRKYTAIVTLCFGAFINQSHAASELLNQVAAVVNDGVVLESDVDNMLNVVQQNAAKENHQLPDVKILRHQIIEKLIMDELVLQEAKRMNIQVNDSQLDHEISQIAKENQLSVQQLRNRITTDGLSFNQYREQVRNDIIQSEVRNNEVRRRVTVLPQEVESLAKQLTNQQTPNIELNLSHILIGVPESPSSKQVADAEKRANDIVAQLKKGADFGKLAATYSTDSYALQGGQMGWGKLAEFPSLFSQPLASAVKGQIIGPIRSAVGFHIIRVNDVRGETKQKVSVTEMKSRHILLRTSVLLNDTQAKERLSMMRDEIINHKATFEELARQYSQDPGTALNGGELGWMLPEHFDPLFANALMHLKKGEISQPVKSAFGWHLIQLEDTRQVDRTDDALKDRAYRMIFTRKFNEETQVWLQELKAAAYVKVISDKD